MTGILVTKFKMDQINVEDLERMAVGGEMLDSENGAGGGKRSTRSS